MMHATALLDRLETLSVILAPPMRILVTGPRDYTDRAHVFGTLDEYRAMGPIEALIHGACPTGVDDMAKEWAVSRDIPHEPYPADWDNIDVRGAVIRFRGTGRSRRPYNALAGFWRNEEMLRRGLPTHGLAFDVDRGTPGTGDMWKRMTRAVSAGAEISLRRA